MRIACAALGILVTLGVSGTAMAQTSSAAGSATAGAPARVSTVQPAKVTKQVPPVYPMEADAEHISGTVVLHFTITKEGTVEDVQFVSGPPELKDAAVAAVTQWVYEPARVSGHVVPSGAEVNLVFKPPPAPPPPSPDATSPTGTGMTEANAAPAPAASAPKRIQIEGKVIAKQIVEQVPPHYPDAAKSALISGKVVMHAIIGTDGSMKELSVISGPKELQATSLNAVRQWRYKPALVNGEAVEVETTVTVIYSLN
jgi:TonB family protein